MRAIVGIRTQIYEYLKSWLVEHGKVSGAAPCVFVQSRNVQEQARDLSANPIAYFASSPDAELPGRIFLVNDDLSQVFEMQIGFSSIQEIAAELQARNLAQQMHAVYRPDRGDLILCEHGLTGGNKRVEVKTGSAQRFSQTDVERIVWQFHRSWTQTPNGLLDCWRGSAADRVTVEKLERRISGALAFMLAWVVGYQNVTMEHDTPHGRADVLIGVGGMTLGLGACVLELKVLRSREYLARSVSGWRNVNADKMVEHASDGLVQAREYLDDTRATLAYLLCFDARLDDLDQPEVLALATTMGVMVRRYYLYSSTSAARDARRAAMLAGIKLSGEP